MAAQSLVLCRDPEVLRTLCPLLFDMEIGVEICLGSGGASRILHKRKFDAVIVECERDGNGLELLQELRADTPNQNTITVGIVDDYEQMKAAFATGANFVLSKPISSEDASRILRFTRGIITRMVRRFLRVAVHRLAHLNVEGMLDPAFILDLSEGGLAMQSLAAMHPGNRVGISFFLPGTETEVEGTGLVVWADPSGRTGLEFTELPDEQRAALKQWVIERVHKNPADAPDAAFIGPAPIRVLSQFVHPLARVIDGLFVGIAAVLFTLVAFLASRTASSSQFPLPFSFLLSCSAGALLYGGLFLAMNVRFPGTRAMQYLLTSASSRRAT
jgi:CheY-like chemotaxis protein